MTHFTPTKHCEYGTSKAVLRSVVAAADGPKQVAHRLGMKRPQAVYEFTDPASPKQMSFHAVAELTSPTNRAAAEALAAKAGCALVPVAKPARRLQDLVADGIREQAEFVASFVGSIPEGLTAIEKLVLLQHADDALRAWGEIRAAIAG